MCSSLSLPILVVCFASFCRATSVEEKAAQHGLSIPDYLQLHYIILAHGILMGFAFAILYPLGAVFIKAFSFKGLLWFHAGWQIIAYIITLAGFGLGVWLVVCTDHDILSTTGHPIIGLVVIGTILLLPPLGWLHHIVFVRTRARSVSTYLHRWIGRVALVLGGINGGLGFWMAHSSLTWGVITYTACASAFYTLWFATVTLFRNRTQAATNDTGELGVTRGEAHRGSDTTLPGSDDENKETR